LDEIVCTAEILFSSQVCAFISSKNKDKDDSKNKKLCGFRVKHALHQKLHWLL
jgi:hypothetical protein